MRKGFKARKMAGFLLIAVLAILLFGWVVMSLWNGVLVAVLHVSTISFAQALGILLLSKILFGGFRGGWRGGGGFRNNMKEKWANMSAEDRERFRAQWQSRCGPWKHTATENEPATEQNK